MIELFEQSLARADRHSSKGNQLKWKTNGIWYKADYTGYEGLAEHVVSHLLPHSNLQKKEYILYQPETIKYKTQNFSGAKSADFLTEDWQIITLERLYHNFCNRSLFATVWSIRDVRERLRFLVGEVERITRIKGFGPYMAKLITIDAFFLNDDRHMHNIAILMNGEGAYQLCPIFDNGACLLSDTKMDYPLTGDVYTLIESVRAKTISSNFDEQLDAAEELYGDQIQFSFEKKDVDAILNEVMEYTPEEIERVRTILYQQMRKYEYLFRREK